MFLEVEKLRLDANSRRHRLIAKIQDGKRQIGFKRISRVAPCRSDSSLGPASIELHYKSVYLFIGGSVSSASVIERGIYPPTFSMRPESPSHGFNGLTTKISM